MRQNLTLQAKHSTASTVKLEAEFRALTQRYVFKVLHIIFALLSIITTILIGLADCKVIDYQGWPKWLKIVTISPYFAYEYYLLIFDSLFV